MTTPEYKLVWLKLRPVWWVTDFPPSPALFEAACAFLERTVGFLDDSRIWEDAIWIAGRFLNGFGSKEELEDELTMRLNEIGDYVEKGVH